MLTFLFYFNAFAIGLAFFVAGLLKWGNMIDSFRKKSQMSSKKDGQNLT